jgi:hypothetical protein
VPSRRPQIHPDDQLSLAEFVALWWAADAPAIEDGRVSEDFEKFVDRKQASLRMLRRNRPDFPTPSGSAGRTQLYRLGDLVSWMPNDDRNTKSSSAALAERAAGVSSLWHFRRALDACRGQLGAEPSRRLAVACVLVLDRLGTKPGLQRPPAAVRRLTSAGKDTVNHLHLEAAAIDEQVPQLRGVADLLLNGIPAGTDGVARLVNATYDVVVSGIPAARLVELALDLLPPTPAVGGESTMTANGLVRLMVAAGDPQPGQHVVDLAAGEGSVLLFAAEATGGPTKLSGYEPDPSAWAIAKSRFHLHGLDIDLRIGRSLDGGEAPLKGDLVLVDPPLVTRLDYRRWLSWAVQCIDLGGRAVVALPAVTLETTRKEWNDIGRQKAGIIVKGPNRLRSDHGDALALWVLDDNPGEQILLVDASRLGRQRGALNDIEPEEGTLLRNSVQAWRRDGRIEVAAPLAALAISRDGSGRSESDLFGRGWSAEHGPKGSDSKLADLDKNLEEAQMLTERLVELVNGPLHSHTSEEHRRALKRLLARLEHDLGADSQ